jgi:ERF superfamily
MEDRMITGEKPTSLPAALAMLQTQLPTIRKSETADTGTYSYDYADLAAVSAALMPLLGNLGLSFMTKPTVTDDGRFVLAYSLLHDSGDREDGEYPLPTGGTPQSYGSAITYGRRYCLCAVTGVAPHNEDDDGAAATAQVKRQGGRPAERKPAADVPQDAPGGMTGKQRAKIMALFGERDISRDQRLDITSQIVGRTLGSANELTLEEAKRVIDALEADAQETIDAFPDEAKP